LSSSLLLFPVPPLASDRPDPITPPVSPPLSFFFPLCFFFLFPPCCFRFPPQFLPYPALHRQTPPPSSFCFLRSIPLWTNCFVPTFFAPPLLSVFFFTSFFTSVSSFWPPIWLGVRFFPREASPCLGPPYTDFSPRCAGPLISVGPPTYSVFWAGLLPPFFYHNHLGLFFFCVFFLCEGPRPPFVFWLPTSVRSNFRFFCFLILFCPPPRFFSPPPVAVLGFLFLSYPPPLSPGPIFFFFLPPTLSFSRTKLELVFFVPPPL